MMIWCSYWNSRLATERQRLINNIFRDSDVVCDMFSGVGPLAISAAKKVKYVYANDINPTAVEYLERNMVLNKLERKIEVFNMDARRFISSIYSSQHVHPVTQIVMNLPNDAAEFLGGYFQIPFVSCQLESSNFNWFFSLFS
jgi:tRNA (guanine37-N1)-methyltransferase